MKKGVKTSLVIGLLACQIISLTARAEEPEYPTVGKPCPDFVLQNIQYYSRKTASLKDFRGKWLLLDFWNYVCGACIISFPHVSDMQKEIGDKLQVIMVGIPDPGHQVNTLYSKYREKEKLVMPCAFDSAIARKFDILTSPYSILIDDKGIVQCITTTIHTEDMKIFLAGGHPVLPKVYRMNEDVPADVDHSLKFNTDKPFAVNLNGGVDSDFLFRSILTKWTPGTSPSSHGVIIESSLKEHPTSFWDLGCPLKDLYLYAYWGSNSDGLTMDSNYGRYATQPVLEMADTSLFQYSYKTGKNMFCYSLNLPLAKVTSQDVQNILQQELKLNFGYAVSIEVRKVPCWKIVANANAREKLKTKGGTPTMQGVAKVGYTANNIPFENVVQIIKAYNYSNYQDFIFDETGITGSVDITMDCKGCVMTDLMDVKKALQKNGLDLVHSEKEMQVLVIKDPKSRNVADK